MSLSGFRAVASKAILAIFLAAFCMLLGMAVAVLPTGLILRGAFALFLVFLLLLSWLARSKAYGLPPAPVAWMLLATIALSILWPRFIFFPVAGVSLNPQSVSVLLMFTICIVILIANANIHKSDSLSALGLWNVGWLILLWFAWRVLSSLMGESPVASTLGILKEVVYTASFIVLSAVVLAYPQAERWLLKTIVFCGLVAVVFGLIEAVLQKNFLIRFASGGESDLAAESLRSIATEKIRDGMNRAQSFFTHPIVFAQFVAALLPLSLYLAMTEKQSRLWRIIGILVLPIGVIAILKSGSRSGLVSIVVSIGFILLVVWLRSFRGRGFSRIIALLAVPFLLISMVAIGQFVQELTQGRTANEAGSTSARMEMLNHGMQALELHPIFGYGHGASLFVAGLTDSKGITSVDSHLLSIAVDSGYPGLALFLLIIFLLVFRLATMAAKNPNSTGLGAGMVASSIMALFATFVGLSTPNNMTFLWILIVLGLFYGKRLSNGAAVS